MVLTEGQFGIHNAKTAMGVIRYGPQQVVAVLDSTLVGRNVAEFLPGHDIPFVASLDEALRLPDRPDALLIGIAPTGGKLPEAWRATILAALGAGLDVLSGLHEFVGDDPEFSAAAHASGSEIVDYRRPPGRMETAVGRRHGPGKRVILTVGTDCALGKMSVALELVAAARRAGRSAAMVPTGQTGMMIEGWGVAVDRLVSDFLNGTVEWLVEHDFDHLPEASFPIAPLGPFIELHERIAGLVAPSAVVAVALNTSLYADDDDARRVIEDVARETGLPAADPLRFGADDLWAAVRERVNALPWVDSR